MLDLFGLGWLTSRRRRRDREHHVAGRRNCLSQVMMHSPDLGDNDVGRTERTNRATGESVPSQTVKHMPKIQSGTTSACLTTLPVPVYESLSDYSVENEYERGARFDNEHHRLMGGEIQDDHQHEEPKLVLVLYANDAQIEQFECRPFEVENFEIRFVNIESEPQKVHAIEQHLEHCTQSPVVFCLFVTHQLANLFSTTSATTTTAAAVNSAHPTLSPTTGEQFVLVEHFRNRSDLLLTALYSSDTELSSFRLKYRIAKQCRFVQMPSQHEQIMISNGNNRNDFVGDGQSVAAIRCLHILRAAIQLNNEKICSEFRQIVSSSSHRERPSSSCSFSVSSSPVLENVSNSRREDPINKSQHEDQDNFRSLRRRQQRLKAPLFEVFPRTLYSIENGQVLIRLSSSLVENFTTETDGFLFRMLQHNTLGGNGCWMGGGGADGGGGGGGDISGEKIPIIDVLVNGRSTFDTFTPLLEWKNNRAFMFTLPEDCWTTNGTMNLALVLDYRWCLGEVQLELKTLPTPSLPQPSSPQSSILPSDLPKVFQEHFNIDSLSSTGSWALKGEYGGESGGNSGGRELLAQIGSEHFLESVLAVSSLDELDVGLVSEFQRNPNAWRHFYQVELGNCSLPTWLHFAAHYGLGLLTEELLKLPNADRIVQLSTAGDHRRPIDLAIQAGHWLVVQSLIEFERRSQQQTSKLSSAAARSCLATNHLTTATTILTVNTDKCGNTPDKTTFLSRNASKNKKKTEATRKAPEIVMGDDHGTNSAEIVTINRDFIDSKPSVDARAQLAKKSHSNESNINKVHYDTVIPKVGAIEHNVYGCDYNHRILLAKRELLFLIDEFKSGMPIGRFERAFKQWERDYEDVLVTQLLNDDFRYSLHEIRKLCRENCHESDV